MIKTSSCVTLRAGKKTWGAMSTALRRMAPSAYVDGVGVPRGGWLAATASCRIELQQSLIQ